MSRLSDLMSAVYEAWSKCLPSPYGSGTYAPVNGQTFCNAYVQEVAENVFSYSAFKGLLANDMVGLMAAHTNEWTQVSGQVAQDDANDGAFVVAGWRNPSGHGHVSIVVPGMPQPSEKWKDPDCPVLANVGELIYCKMGITANWAFGAEPTYFLLNESLS
jgi:hypothetical protein